MSMRPNKHKSDVKIWKKKLFGDNNDNNNSNINREISNKKKKKATETYQNHDRKISEWPKNLTAQKYKEKRKT